ncbi:MAG: hypothetical protein WAM82_18255 [Thermoanaerobaculia bacterium]
MTELTEFFLSRLPPLLLERIAASGVSGVERHSILGIGQDDSFDQDSLFEAARRALSQGKDESLTSLQGKAAFVATEAGVLVLKIKQSDDATLNVPFPELDLLSPDPNQRLQAFDLLLSELGPMASSFSELRQAAGERELSNEDVRTMMLAKWEGVSYFRSRTRARLSVGAKLYDLVPDSLEYFELFCGTDPRNLTPKEYLETVLPSYRKELLRRDLRQGLEVCLLGALRDDLCPGPWLKEVGDNELWESLQSCQPDTDPFSLLAALDLSLYREHDKRFRGFAEKAVARLAASEFLNSDGIDVYVLMPLLAEYTLGRLNEIEGGVLRAPFWRRMCAWMQAGLVSRLLQGFGINLEQIQMKIGELMSPKDLYIRLLDLRREPMFEASEISTLMLRRETLGRLLTIRERHQSEGRTVPGVEEIEVAREKLQAAGPRAMPFLPGPLEGTVRPEEKGNELSEELKKLALGLTDDGVVAALSHFSQNFHLDEESKEALVKVVSKSRHGGDTPDHGKLLSRLLNATAAAAAERDLVLAQAIADSLQSLAPGLQENLVIPSLDILLAAGAAIEDQRAWSAWLEEQLAQLALRLPARGPSGVLWNQIQTLKTLTKLGLRAFNRAEAIASAATN